MSVAAPIPVTKSSSVKCVQKLSKPRPLRLNSSGESENIPPLVSPVSLTYTNVENINEDDVLRELENLHVNISNGNFDSSTISLVTRVCQLLKLRGAHIDSNHKDQLDVYMVTLRSAAAEDRLDMTCRTRLLEILELRSMKWRPTEDVTEYFKKLEPEMCSIPSITPQNQTQSVSQMGVMGHHHHHHPLLQQPLVQANGPAMIIPQYIPITQFPLAQAMPSVQPNVLANVTPLQQVQPPFMPGEVLRSSGKFGKPAKIPGRNFLKDEIVIRNSDSGKVMGIKGRRVHMIEEMSDTVISFQRVNPGMRERLVQITGSGEENILQAKQLIEETIRRNASPVRENSSVDESSAGSYEESLTTSPSQGAVSPQDSLPKAAPVLQHSMSTSDATVDRDYTFSVQGIKISAPRQLALVAKTVLEQHFSAAAMLQTMTDPNFVRVSQHMAFNQDLLSRQLDSEKTAEHWSASTSSDEESKNEDTTQTTATLNAREPQNESRIETSSTTLLTRSRDELLDLAECEFAKKPPTSLGYLDDELSFILVRQPDFDIKAFRKWTPSNSTNKTKRNDRVPSKRSSSNESEETP